jgi:heme/copper-type cytochrome/quinol oxidase subunit 3
MTRRIRLTMLLFIASEGTFFALLIAAYVFYHLAGGEGPTAANSLDVVRTAFFSAALFSSSLTVWLATGNLRRQRRRQAAFWLLATIVLGATFLYGEASEYLELWSKNVTISRNLFGTTFFTLTGFHGLHVSGGLVLLGMLLGLTAAGPAHEPADQMIEGVSIYWHFVDAVWVFIFSIVYLWRFV